MFENTTYFDFDDDDILATSFTPVSSSTQSYQANDRSTEEKDVEESKKLKLGSTEQNAFSKQLSVKRSPNEIKEIPFNSPNKVVKRKFPGPAGLLPDRKDSGKSLKEHNSNESSVSDDSNYGNLLLCSQQTLSTFEDGPWKEMTKDFCVSDGVPPYEKFNVNWIKKQALMKKLLVNHKAPFLAAIIQSLEILDGKEPTVNITLKDATGDIQGTILHSLYEEYSDYFTVGSVLVLKQFGVLSAGYNNHCLTITLNNLVTIYCLEVPKLQPDTDSVVNKSRLIKKIAIQSCTAEEILHKYDEDMKKSQVNKINFGRLHQNSYSMRRSSSLENNTCDMVENHGNFLRKNSDDSYLYKVDNKKSVSVTSAPLKVFNKTTTGSNNEFILSRDNNENIKIPTSFNIGSDKDTPKKFNFKQKNSSLVNVNLSDSHSKCDENVNSNIKKCDETVVKSSHVTIKADSKEHAEIWKQLLEDVDTDSLFDDF